MKISVGLSELSEARMRYAKQMGAHGVSIGAYALDSYNQTGRVDVGELKSAKSAVAAHGLDVFTLRLRPQATHDILTDGPNAQREIDNVVACVRAAGEAGVPFLYYNLTPWRSLPTAWGDMPGAPSPEPGSVSVGSGPGRYYRPNGRGGAVLLTHRGPLAERDQTTTPEESVAPYGRIMADQMWDRIGRMYEAVIPAAEEAGVNVGAHPNDPPEPIYRGVEQVMNTVDGLNRLVDLVDSPRSGLLLCIGTLHEMGEDTMAAMDSLLSRGKIFYAHFRNPKGTVPGGDYQEDFLDEGDLNMMDVMRLYKSHGYTGAFDPDHAQGIEGDEGGRIGFAWELGYMRALLKTVMDEG